MYTLMYTGNQLKSFLLGGGGFCELSYFALSLRRNFMGNWFAVHIYNVPNTMQYLIIHSLECKLISIRVIRKILKFLSPLK